MKSKLLQRLVVGAGVMAASAGAFAQASSVIVDTGIVSNISAVTQVVVDVGGAVLAVVTVAWGYKTVKGFIGR